MRRHQARELRPLLLLFLLLLPFSLSVAAQDWQPIPPEELALKDNPAQPGAPAMILYREVLSDDIKEFQTFYYRIKIFNEEGKKYADVVIYYWEKRYQVEEIRARTVRPDGTSVPFQGQIYDRLMAKAKKVKVQAKTFTLPDVQAGSIIEYSYKIRFRNPFPECVKKPSNCIFTRAFTWPTESWVVQDDLYIRRARFSIRPLPTRLAWTTASLRPGESPNREPDGSYILEVKEVPAFQQEEYAPPESTLKGRVDFYYLFGSVSSADDFWSAYGKQRAEDLQDFLNKKKAMEREVARITSPSDAPDVKLRKLYARVQQIRYISFERSRTEKEAKRENLTENKHVEDILNHGYAYANEINLLFVALARAAGFEAWPVDVAARNSIFFIKSRLDTSQLNAMVVLVRRGSDSLYFDPATRFCPFDLLPWEESGVQGVVLSSFGGTIVTTSARPSDAAVVERQAKLELLEGGALKGKLQIFYRGQEALDRRIDALDDDEAGRRKNIEDEVKGWLPAGSTVEIESITNWDKSEEPLRVDCSVTIPNLGVSTGRRLLLPTAVFQVGQQNPFRHNSRVHPVYFRHRYQEVDDVTVQVPEGFRIESLPAPRKDTTEFASMEVKRENQAGALRMQRRFAMEGFYFPQPYYQSLRRFYDRVRSADGERVVLQASETAKSN